jgi:hypothetical protein
MEGNTMLKQMSGPLQSGNIGPHDQTLMYYYRTSNLNNPGAADYITEDTILNLKR